MPVTMATTGRVPIFPTDIATGPSVRLRSERALVSGSQLHGHGADEGDRGGRHRPTRPTSRPSAGGTPADTKLMVSSAVATSRSSWPRSWHPDLDHSLAPAHPEGHGRGPERTPAGRGQVAQRDGGGHHAAPAGLDRGVGAGPIHQAGDHSAVDGTGRSPDLVGDLELHHVGGTVVVRAVGEPVEEFASHGHGVMVGGPAAGAADPAGRARPAPGAGGRPATSLGGRHRP